ncbi:hypothetical protein PR048_016658 [Dryococelus australis]|uniref:CST complex subunit CTC1 n=1 Tax=Dryococelus australis TaxID=614101 RepID=A0ABQ9H7E5_9NEOP|nr:hypothetical protein PR048_016658 [Dryococelus australis]
MTHTPPTAQRPKALWKESLDLMGLYPRTKQDNQYILVVTDQFIREWALLEEGNRRDSLPQTPVAVQHERAQTAQKQYQEKTYPTVTEDCWPGGLPLTAPFHHTVVFYNSLPDEAGLASETSRSRNRMENVSSYFVCVRLSMSTTLFQVEIVLDDATCRKVFLGISHFPCSCILMLQDTHLVSPSLALKTSMLRLSQIYPLRQVHAYGQYIKELFQISQKPYKIPRTRQQDTQGERSPARSHRSTMSPTKASPEPPPHEVDDGWIFGTVCGEDRLVARISPAMSCCGDKWSRRFLWHECGGVCRLELMSKLVKISGKVCGGDNDDWSQADEQPAIYTLAGVTPPVSWNRAVERIGRAIWLRTVVLKCLGCIASVAQPCVDNVGIGRIFYAVCSEDRLIEARLQCSRRISPATRCDGDQGMEGSFGAVCSEGTEQTGANELARHNLCLEIEILWNVLVEPSCDMLWYSMPWMHRIGGTAGEQYNLQAGTSILANITPIPTVDPTLSLSQNYQPVTYLLSFQACVRDHVTSFQQHARQQCKSLFLSKHSSRIPYLSCRSPLLANITLAFERYTVWNPACRLGVHNLFGAETLRRLCLLSREDCNQFTHLCGDIRKFSTDDYLQTHLPPREQAQALGHLQEPREGAMPQHLFTPPERTSPAHLTPAILYPTPLHKPQVLPTPPTTPIMLHHTVAVLILRTKLPASHSQKWKGGREMLPCCEIIIYWKRKEAVVELNFPYDGPVVCSSANHSPPMLSTLVSPLLPHLPLPFMPSAQLAYSSPIPFYFRIHRDNFTNDRSSQALSG